jgi:hypothetical protein
MLRPASDMDLENNAMFLSVCRQSYLSAWWPATTQGLMANTSSDSV